MLIRSARAPAPTTASALSLSRRRVLLGALAASAWACQAGDIVGPPQRPTTSSAVSASSGAPPDALDVVRLGPLPEDEKGGVLVVLLHGWRAQGDDLVSLARELARPRARFLVPAAPLPEPGGGRAWWPMDTTDRPVHVWTDELPPNFQPNARVAASRRAVQAVLRDAKQRYAPDTIALAGFSQGAMLALDVALAADPPVDRVAVLSGVLLADSLPALQLKKASPAVFVSHGRSDPVLPFEGGASIERVLAPHGLEVTFFAFEGAHEIPPAVVSQLRRFLFG